MTRGASINPANPFERSDLEEDPAALEELRRVDPEWEPPTPKTAFFVDDAQTLIPKNESPDLSFEASLEDLVPWSPVGPVIPATAWTMSFSDSLHPLTEPGMRFQRGDEL